MLIKPFLCALTKAEMHQIMCSGFATIAGSVLTAYMALGVSGTALISSCMCPHFRAFMVGYSCWSL